MDRWKLWKTVLASWGFTLMGVFNIAVLLAIATFLAMRVIGPNAIVAVLMPSLALMIAIFFGGEAIVNTIYNARTPHPEHDERAIRVMSAVSKQAGMWVRPRLWILSLGGVPNAMAYGPGLPFLAAVGVTRELVDMLKDDELAAVIGHELAHIRCRDTGIMGVIGFILGAIDKLRGALLSRNSLLMQSSVAFVLAYAIYGIGRLAFAISRFAISQERELAADALGSWYVGSPDPLIRALRKLHARRPQKDEEKAVFADLMTAHPGLEERIASLTQLRINRKKEITHGV